MGRKVRKDTVPQKYVFPERLRGLIAEKYLSQETLGKAVGLSRQTVSNYMSGRRIPNIADAQRIADYFNVSLMYLLSEYPLRQYHTIDQIKDMVRDYLGEESYSLICEMSKLSPVGQNKVRTYMSDLLAAEANSCEGSKGV